MVSDLNNAEKEVTSDNDTIVDLNARIAWGEAYLKESNVDARAAHVRWMSSRIADQRTLAEANHLQAANKATLASLGAAAPTADTTAA